ncbi:MAG: VWA domain-containing protein [bacterium]|nr:VWA domain-containing protein [bacterium]
MNFAAPEFLILLVLLAALAMWLKGRKRHLTVKYPDAGRYRQLENRFTRFLSALIPILRYAAIAMLIIAIALPRIVDHESNVNTEGIDIMLALDTSGSMSAEDLSPNRFESAKDTIKRFVAKRNADRLGLVVFGGTAYTQCPLTLDRDVLASLIDQTQLGLGGQGTAIGSAVATAVSRLRKSDAKSKIIILLTDGENNAGIIDPLTAANLAKELRIKVYVIGVGKEGGARIPVMHPRLGKTYQRNPDGSYAVTKLDENLLKQIAVHTNGHYFRATDNESLEQIYDEINQLEKSQIKSQFHYNVTELFPLFLLIAFCLLVLESIIANAILITVP